MYDLYNIYRGAYKEYIESIQKYRPINKYFEYSERHHVIPSCLGGIDDDIENIRLYMTPSEHLRAHIILSEENPEILVLLRIVMLMSDNNKLSPDEYEHLKKRFSDSQRGNKHGEGHNHSDEWKEACSSWMSGRKNCLGRIWINNGSKSMMISPEQFKSYEEDGWILGRGKVHSASTLEKITEINSSRMWINDGSTSKMILKSSPIPTGWTRGRILNKGYHGRIVSN